MMPETVLPCDFHSMAAQSSLLRGLAGPRPACTPIKKAILLRVDTLDITSSNCSTSTNDF